MNENDLCEILTNVTTLLFRLVMYFLQISGRKELDWLDLVRREMPKELAVSI